MSALKFTSSHNMQFWTTAKVKTVNGEIQIQALVDKKKLTLIGSKTNAWNEFSSTMASAIICLAINQKFNFSVYIFDNMVKNLEGGVKFLMYLSGEDILKLNELMELCTNLSQRVFDLENTKTSQSTEIAKLKEKVKKLEIRSKSRTPGLKRLRKAQGRIDDNLMFDTGVFDEQEVKVEKTLIKIKATKPKAVTTAATTTTTAVTRPKARGVVAQEPSELRTTTSSSQTLQLHRLQEELKAELEEEERLARQKKEEDNLILWDNIQAMMEADYKLA
ncbi:hypothetical protein Tco_1469787 [Tanacetum coccineum]